MNEAHAEIEGAIREASSSPVTETARLAQRIAAGEPGLGAGHVAGVVAALAASLVEQGCRGSTSWQEGAGYGAQAQACRERCLAFAAADAVAFAEAMSLLSNSRRSTSHAGNVNLGEALWRASDVPFRLAEAAADVAQLAARCVDDVDSDFRADVAAATVLAEAAARVGAHLFRVNLTTTPQDGRLEQANSLLSAAATASQHGMSATAP